MSATTVNPADTTTEQTALLGITTPLAGLFIPSNATAPIVAIVSTRLGVLTADTAAGALVRGNGSTLLWISGTIAQVNGKLATLTYAGATTGTDELSIAVLSSSGILTPVVQSTIAVVPLVTSQSTPSNLISYTAGTLTLESRVLDGPTISLREPTGSSNSTTLVLINSTIGLHSRISVQNDNSVGNVKPRIAIAGRVELDGSMVLNGTSAAVSLAQGATFFNDGTISIDAHAAQFTGNGTLINNGLILVTGDGTVGAIPRIDTNLTGSGVVSLVGGASVEIGGSVGTAETIWLGAGANTLHLAQPSLFAGQIAGFSGADLVVLDGITVTNAFGSHSAESDSTVVTLYNGAANVGTILFSTTEPNTIFRLGTDASGNATIALVPVATSATSSSTEVFRFFDEAHGTQLLTQDATERDTIIGSRPDMHYEGVGLRAIDPAQSTAAATAVFRFFDTTNGTHFMTASATERDSLLGSRPDLVFEPSSTIFEHSAAQAGDSAVYRFFDQQSGTHFFTADAGERASILSTRPDMTLEGIAFYAPTV